MNPFPQHPPFDSFARAVQAYAYSRANGGSIAQAEANAARAWADDATLNIPAIALAAAQSGRTAAALFLRPSPEQYALSERGIAAAMPGAHTLIATVRVQYIPGGAIEPRWTSIQVSVPIGSGREAMLEQIRADAQALVASTEYRCTGSLVGGMGADTFVVVSVVGTTV